MVIKTVSGLVSNVIHLEGFTTIVEVIDLDVNRTLKQVCNFEDVTLQVGDYVNINYELVENKVDNETKSSITFAIEPKHEVKPKYRFYA